MFVLWMGGMADGFEEVRISGHTSNIFRRTTTGGIEQEWKSPCSRVVEPLFELIT